MSACQIARDAPLPSIVTASKPGVSFSTRKPLTWPSSSERAHTTTTSAIEPLPIQRLAPSSTQSSPSRRALVSSATESEPCSGSVSANAPIASSRAIAGSQRSFCSSEPSRSIDFIASPDCTPRNVPRLPSPRCSSMLTRPRASGLMPGAAVALDVLAQQAELGEPAHQRPRQLGRLPVLVDHRQHLAVDEAARGDEVLPLLVGELLADLEVVGGERVAEVRVGERGGASWSSPFSWRGRSCRAPWPAPCSRRRRAAWGRA